MDKLSIAIFFLFFAFSFALTPLTQKENDITNIKLPESDATPTTNQFDKETQHVQENQDHLPESRDKKNKALPLTFVRLRSINHHFPARSRRPSRLCDHHHFHYAHNLKPRTQSTHLDDQIPYGNDMIPSDDDDDDFEHVFPGGLHQVPEEWMNFLHQNNEDDDDDDVDEQKMSKFIIKRNKHDKFGKMKLKGHLYDPFEEEHEHEDEDGEISAMQYEDHHSFDKKKMKKHLHHHHEEEEQEAVEGNETHKEEKKTGGLVKHIRKFLDNYFD
ncbi:hypothetical protein H5410_043854 [Solanum commersonii]|uniref:Uncharacterized protein n=1 Tax=Solanum commersonii TaxID=4109 RepID=A0A9J5Y208_SOLCO|nr:hypothetical protein H5410_043854 [Solanum commersonii]